MGSPLAQILVRYPEALRTDGVILAFMFPFLQNNEPKRKQVPFAYTCTQVLAATLKKGG